MSIRTILLAIVAGDGERPRAAIDHALALAASHRAHLSILVGAIKVPVVVYTGVAEAQAIVTEANNDRTREAGVLADEIGRGASMLGVNASVEVITDAIDPLFTRISKRARLHDLSVCGRPRETDIWAKELAETLLLSSGRPVVVVPDGFKADRAANVAIIAWDGTAVAARAVGEAIPLLEKVASVEIVTVAGDKHADDLVPGAELAPMIAHHGLKVTVTQLSGSGRHAGEAVSDHANHTRAKLIVMGGYAHSRLRQMVLGGATRTMLQSAPVPVFLAH